MSRSDIISCLLRVTQIIRLKRDAIYLLFVCENGYHHSFINCELGSPFCQKLFISEVLALAKQNFPKTIQQFTSQFPQDLMHKLYINLLMSHMCTQEAIEHSRSGRKHSTTSQVLSYTSFVHYRFLCALQQNRAQ